MLDDVPVSEVPIPEEGAPAASGSPDGSDGAPVEVDADLAPADQGDDGPKTWSFLNLIFTILVGVQMLLLGMRWIAARSSEKALYDHRPDPNRQTTESEENKNRIAHSKRKLATSLFALAGTVALIVLFAISENLSMPMELINRYTVCYVLINAAIAALAMLTDPSILKRRGNN